MRMANMLGVAVVATASALLFGLPAHASHMRIGVADYVGELHDDSSFDEIVLTDEVDYYLLHVLGGQQVTLNVSQGDTGSLLPNVSIFDGVVPAGSDPVSEGLTELFFSPLTDNSSSLSISGSFTPTADATWTLLVTTWEFESGTYDIRCSGCAPEETEVIPLPLSLSLLLTGLAGLAVVGRRGS